MSLQVLTTKQLSERWECSEQAIRDRVDAGTLKPLKNLPRHRFSVSYIEEIENSQCDPLSPMEKRKLLNRIKGLEEKLEYKEKIISSIESLILVRD